MIPDDWEATRVTADADGPPADADWEPVEVPGKPAEFTDADAVAYRTRFEAPGDRAVLRLDGVYGDADVYLDGDHLAEHAAYWRPLTVGFDGGGERELVVVCRRPGRFGGVYETDRVPAEAAVPGVWRDARVEPVEGAYLADLSVRPRLTDDGAVIDAALAVEAESDLDDRVRFSIRPEGFRGGGMMDQARVSAEAGERATVEQTIRVRDAKRWWPADLGPQRRYAVRAKVGDASETATTGFCSVEYGDDGLRVNGERMRARGFNLLPGGDPEADLRRAVEAGANLVRVPAHVAPPALYDAADDAGVLVWQGLPLSGDGEFDAARAESVAAQVVDACSRHPSVAAYGVHDDALDVARGLAGASLARWRLRWRAWRASYDRSAAEEVAETLPDRPAFPVVGGPGADPDAAAVYPGWRFGDADEVDWLLDWRPDLADAVAAFGAGALADADGADGEDGGAAADAAGFDADVHAAHVEGGVEESQAYQARVVKRVAERLRLAGSDVLAVDALRDADDGAGMGVVARDGTPKRAYDAVAASFEPVQAVLAEWPTAGGSVEAAVVNDTAEAVEAAVSWTAGAESDDATVEVPAFGQAAAGSVTVPGDAERVELAVEVGDHTASNEYRVG